VLQEAATKELLEGVLDEPRHITVLARLFQKRGSRRA